MKQNSVYSRERFVAEENDLLLQIRAQSNVESARHWLYMRTTHQQFDAPAGHPGDPKFISIRDCARALRSMLAERADGLAKFSLVGALWDLACGMPRPDLTPAFFADLSHLLLGMEGRETVSYLIPDQTTPSERTGREAAILRSDELDRISRIKETFLNRYDTGMSPESRERRADRRAEILAALGGTPADWMDWAWQTAHILRDPNQILRAIRLRPEEEAAVRKACAAGMPFGITPYYASLMDNDPEAGRDRAVRTQVLPPMDTVEETIRSRARRPDGFDFMCEGDTSPIDLITRRYPHIVILKPFNTCPQICVYCQRNWEIDQPMEPGALASWDAIEAACAWIEAHPAIREVLVTGGDPFALEDEPLLRILSRVAAIPHVDLIRIGTRTLVTLPMRVTDSLARRLGKLRQPGRREICIMT
ncbi:MAG: KamA family radical SAM protein, partial [Kiritimatiellia bacterium]|nr:KamA family radical SAM protein [Kiritimatiellia bacterium]